MSTNKKKKIESNAKEEGLIEKESKRSIPAELGKRLEQRNAYWNAAVQSLEAQEFPNVEVAVEAVIAAVLGQVAEGAESKEELKELLWCMFETDAEMEHDLRAALQIKG